MWTESFQSLFFKDPAWDPLRGRRGWCWMNVSVGLTSGLERRWPWPSWGLLKRFDSNAERLTSRKKLGLSLHGLLLWIWFLQSAMSWRFSDWKLWQQISMKLITSLSHWKLDDLWKVVFHTNCHFQSALPWLLCSVACRKHPKIISSGRNIYWAIKRCQGYIIMVWS